jgi:hypothetical protein
VALDEPRGLLFVGCADGDVVALDVTTGAVRDRLHVGQSIDHVAFSATRRHLYVPDTDRADMTILGVSRTGELTELGRISTVRGTECVTTDERGHVYLCDPTRGAIVVVADDDAAVTTWGHSRGQSGRRR